MINIRALRYAYGCRGFYYQKIDPKEALLSLRKAVALDPTPIALSNIAVHYIKFEHNRDSAKLYLKKSFTLLGSPAYKNNTFHRAVVFLAKGDFLMAGRHYKEAIRNYNEVIELSKHFVDPDMVLESKYAIAKAHRYLGDRENEVACMERAKAMEDSLAVARNSALTVSVDKLIDENRAFQQSAAKHRTVFGLIAAVSGIALILTVFLLFRYRNRMKKEIQRKEVENSTLKNLVDCSHEEGFNQKNDSLIEMAKKNDPKFFDCFQEVYPEFFDTLRVMDPKISNDTLKFCAMAFLNFSTKNISEYTFVTVRAVQIRKNRLRKKFHIPSEVDFNHWTHELVDNIG